jgi:hypothetical protein
VRIGPTRFNHNLIAAANSKGHQGDGAASVGLMAVRRDLHLSRQSLDRVNEQRSRTCVDPMLERNVHAPHDATGGRIRNAARIALPDRKLHQEVSSAQGSVLAAAQDAETAACGEDYGRQQTLGTLGYDIHVEADQRLTGTDVRPRTGVLLETLAAEPYGVYADVDQHLDAAGCAHSHRMPGCRKQDDFTITRCEDRRGSRVYQHAIAEHAAGEHRIGCFLE